MSGASERERTSSPASSLKTVSDDEEIDYTVKPEFYDSELDDKDELWVTNKRKGRDSDAVLSCPACFTILCYGSQRHETYVTQYRAIFVVNCKIKNNQVLAQESRKQKRQKARQPSTNEGSSQISESVYRQVCCDVCATAVGVIDDEEVYHFYDVIPTLISFDSAVSCDVAISFGVSPFIHLRAPEYLHLLSVEPCEATSKPSCTFSLITSC